MVIYAELIGGKIPVRGSYLGGVSINVGPYGGGPLNSGVSVGLNDPRITFLGGSVATWGTTYPRYLFNKTLNVTLADGSRDGVQGKVAFETNATSFDLKIYSVGTVSSFTLLVDGNQVNATMVSTSADGSLRYVSVDLAAAGLAPGYHSIVFDFYGGANFGGLVLPTGSTVRPLTDSGPRMVFLGDSFTEGNGAANRSEDYASIAAQSLGVTDVWQSALGGTGWKTPLNNRPALVDRIQQDGVNANGDIYVIAMGVNDSISGLYDSVVRTLTQLTQGRPDAKIFVIGAWNTSGPAINPRANINAEIAAAVALFPNVRFLDPSAVTFTKSDATHPDASGQWKLGEWVSEQIRQALGADGLIEQNVAGDIVGPVFLKDYNPAETYQFSVLKGGIPSTQFELVPTGNAFPVLKLIDGQAVSAVGAIALTLQISGSLGTNYSTQVSFNVRQRVDGSPTNDYLVSSVLGSFIDAGDGDDYLLGKGGADRLVAGNGNDKLDGGVGGDMMLGGGGNDQYWLDSVADTVVEDVNGGYDVVSSSMDGYMLPENVEGLNLIGGALSGGGNSANNYLRGNALANILYGHAGDDRLDGFDGSDILYGNDGNDVLSGGAGADSMTGGSGNDTYYVENSLDVVNESSNGGYDRVISNLANYSLTSYVENLYIDTGGQNGTGNSLNNRLYGNAEINVLSGLIGHDEFFGGAGADTYLGGAGNDTFRIEDDGDLAIENFNEGVDLAIVTKAGSYTLPDNIESMELRGQATTGTGNSLNNYLYANSGISHLFGGEGNDWLHSSDGNDTLTGEAGNDVYTIDGPGVTITEAFGADYDRVIANFSNYVLPANVEELNLTGSASGGTGNESANYMRGGAMDDVFYGLGGNDTIEGADGSDVLWGGVGDDNLNGGIGADTMYGGVGNDTFYVDNERDQVFEFSAEGGDRIISSAAAFALPDNVETLSLSAGAISGTGNNANNVLQGNSVNNTLIGFDGSDRLFGGAGNDKLDGGSGWDYLDGGADIDTALYATARSDFSFSFSGSTLFITNLATGDRDTLLNMETIMFSDGSYQIDYNGSGLILI